MQGFFSWYERDGQKMKKDKIAERMTERMAELDLEGSMDCPSESE